ncbi:MAG: VOC family protein [Tatlockia sp.]|nr:VOC family protein [Tatlockia sp.]
MSIEFNHTIVHAKNARESAKFLTDILGLPAASFFGPFMVVKTANNVSLDFRTTSSEVIAQHFAFLVSETEFDEILQRITQRQLDFWADPAQKKLNQINHGDGGRGCYFLDPNGHFLEILTRPYDSAIKSADLKV